MKATMNPTMLAGLVLLAAGALGLVYGGFSYTQDTHEASVGPLTMSVTEKRRVNIPLWAGVGALLAGGLLVGISVRR